VGTREGHGWRAGRGLRLHPAGWPADAYTIVRRVRVDAETISTDPRSRRRRTIPADQLTLALDGQATHAYAVSFIVTNIPTFDTDEPDGSLDTIVDVEAWFRRRTDIEDRIREAKLGAALRWLPSGHPEVNAVWMWAALLAGNLSVILQALTGLDHGGRAHAARPRHQLLCVPARVVRHARGLTLRLPPGQHWC
jgi:Transposase DDE domain group 1